MDSIEDEEPEYIPFRFHLDPFEDLEKDRRPVYCTFDEFKMLCSKETPREALLYLWYHF